MDDKWLNWAKRLQAIAQSGLTFTDNKYEIERYRQVQDLAAEIMCGHTNHSKDEVLDLIKKEYGYATPKIDTRGVVFNDEGKILLVRELVDNGRWTLPGGWADVALSPSENVEREVWEESGYKVKAVKLLAVYDREKQGHKPSMPFHLYKMFFMCELLGGRAEDSIETEEATFFGRDEIPELSESRVLRRQIQKIFEFYDNPDLPADFD